MKKQINLILLSLISFLMLSCGDKQVIVWKGTDLIGLGILALCLIFFGGVYLLAWLSNKFDELKKRRYENKRKH